MTKDEIIINGLYRAKVSGKLVLVKITKKNLLRGWDALNVFTGRTIQIKTAARLRPCELKDELYFHKKDKQEVI